ncbi:hypothetical protein AXF42_Ash010519 [Apostasia shenzhenica]|uniref:Uncharacterized protein n=1 Tax=Apostasia shenzhenica TaxID=1088818 RepID=A0A2I0A6B2_9ASPA|nr:hypothetical protein AXF42_Ash010519 [Apostasia shenzhenica]
MELGILLGTIMQISSAVVAGGFLHVLCLGLSMDQIMTRSDLSSDSIKPPNEIFFDPLIHPVY